MGNLTADLRFALRTFRKSPIFVVVALLSLANLRLMRVNDTKQK